MKSMWSSLKSQAINLRKRGYSVRVIEAKLGIPKSTLSYWFKLVVLTEKQNQKLLSQWRDGLVQARKKAVLWHNQQKAARIAEAEKAALLTVGNLSVNGNLLDLALAMLYLGEGFKKSSGTAMGNSDPLILKFFLTVLRKNYKIEESKIKCELHLRADQDPKKIIKYWSSQLRVPKKNFTSISFDQRTKGSQTYRDYHGVCIVRCSAVAIQRKLMAISKIFCNSIL